MIARVWWCRLLVLRVTVVLWTVGLMDDTCICLGRAQNEMKMSLHVLDPVAYWRTITCRRLARGAPRRRWIHLPTLILRPRWRRSKLRQGLGGSIGGSIWQVV